MILMVEILDETFQLLNLTDDSLSIALFLFLALEQLINTGKYIFYIIFLSISIKVS